MLIQTLQLTSHTSTGLKGSFLNTDRNGSETLTSRSVIAETIKGFDHENEMNLTNSSNTRRHLNDSHESGDRVPRSISGMETLASRTGKILNLETLQLPFHR